MRSVATGASCAMQPAIQPITIMEKKSSDYQVFSARPSEHSKALLPDMLSGNRA